MSYKSKLKNIKAFVFDIDGVFTDGSVYLMPDKSMCRVMNVLDGYAVVKAIKLNYPICVITGGDDPAVRHRHRRAAQAVVNGLRQACCWWPRRRRLLQLPRPPQPPRPPLRRRLPRRRLPRRSLPPSSRGVRLRRSTLDASAPRGVNPSRRAIAPPRRPGPPPGRFDSRA